MKNKVFKACLQVIEKGGWKKFTFAKASQDSGIPLSLFHAQFSSPSDVMATLFNNIDEEVLKNPDFSMNKVSPKDALFEILMARFDAALPYKSILQSFWHDWIFSPTEAPPLLCHGFASMSWMLEAAGLNTRGLPGFLRIQGLTILYGLTLRVWLKDESPDMGKTMVFLDNGLSQLEKGAPFLKGFDWCSTP
jgi:ubiquinone biosynthesis protein COQ9